MLGQDLFIGDKRAVDIGDDRRDFWGWDTLN
jgi:hypothetical protein